jgi:hypothetical protein
MVFTSDRIQKGTIMSRRRAAAAFSVLCCCLALVSAPCAAAEAAVKGRVADLAWMTGSWIGAFGEQTLEESWVEPKNGTIGCLVRLTQGDATNMLEFILIEDVDDTVVFRVRQWFPGFVPRRPEPQVMTLTEFGDRRVSFSGSGDVDFRTLAYSRPAEDQFHIDAETMSGERLQLKLRRR